ncbi:tripartite tricarboxylate transporter substrate binding protein [Xylophilus sp. GOD-11R]|uniref:Bug family tripartite tricarboxylate transporter substrate binding protein n=1 Tax=Xylophilus sp. GOD-11R TaxID=3089814 RepID=UPI00298C2941|nr:tripartite tricarboxylate transporter substrate binding protein [Xylophilus sp. GOD-11R]WPB58369.1 tripartite tricarboxylate transporter substrate binding protein [Xylophilus sp. GOD-11R]
MPTASPDPHRRRWLGAAALAPLASLRPLSSRAAEAWPARPIRVVVPFAAGGATDILGRLLGKTMEPELGQPVVIDNRIGAAGAIGASNVARSPADGYSVLFGGVGTNVVLPMTQPALDYAPDRDFTAVGQICNIDYVLVVAAGSPDRTLADLLKRAKASPRAVSYMSTGSMGPLHVSIEYLSQQAGAQMTHVPYKGESPAFADLIEGRLDVAVMTVPFTRPYIKDGKLRALATISGQRSAAMPELPTVAELGFPGYAVPIWNGLFVPTGTPAPAIARLSAAMLGAVRQPAIREQMVAMGVTPTGLTPQESVTFLAGERERWARMIRETGVLKN